MNKDNIDILVEKRTAGEWYVSEGIKEDKNMCPISYYEIGNKTDVTWIAHVANGSFKSANGEGKANAAFICKAVNEYDNLKEQNTELLEQLADVRQVRNDVGKLNEHYIEQNTKLAAQNKCLLTALKRIESVYDWKGDFAGQVAHEAIKETKQFKP